MKLTVTVYCEDDSGSDGRVERRTDYSLNEFGGEDEL